MKLNRKTAIFALLALALPLLATAGPKADVAITLNSMTAVGTVVTLDVTNDSTIAVNVEINIRAFFCADTTMPHVNCEKVATSEFSRRLAALERADDLTVSLPVSDGYYIFRAQVTGSKGSAEDQKFGFFVGHTVP